MNRIIFHIDVNSAFLSWEAAKRVKNGESDIREIWECKSDGLVIQWRDRKNKMPPMVGKKQDKTNMEKVKQEVKDNYVSNVTKHM